MFMIVLVCVIEKTSAQLESPVVIVFLLIVLLYIPGLYGRPGSSLTGRKTYKILFYLQQ